jgi:hypothetical protein
MTSQSPRIYLYKITFEEVPYYYYGVHKEKYFNEEYWGSPVTNKWCWEFYTPKKQILQFFDHKDEGWLEAQEVEMRLIKPVFNTDKWCLNASCGRIFSLDVCRKNGRKVGAVTGQKTYELSLGIFGLSREQRHENSKKSGKRCYELGLGIHGLTFEERSNNSKKAVKKTNSQKWMCTETNHISNSGALANYQRAKGIDTSKRVRVS